MAKFYKVIKENFLWEVGAILDDGVIGGNGYRPIDNIWKKYSEPESEYISAPIIENCPEYFERVYPVNLLTKMVYKAKEEAKELISKNYNS